MFYKIGSVSRKAFSEKESLSANELLNDVDDLYISESLENSSVMGNISYAGLVEAPAMPFEDDKDIYAEPSDSTVTSASTDSIDTQPIPAGRLSLPQRITRTIPKLAEDMPWALYGNDHGSRLANNALDAGDDIHITPSCEQDDFSVVGNSSVAPFDPQSTTGEPDEDNYASPTIATQANKTKKGLFRKLSLTKKITRILPSKQYVSKLSKLAEDVPWSMNAQEQISKPADETLNSGDDLFITESFEPLEADTSSVLGNTSYISGTESSLGSGATGREERDDESAHWHETTRAMNEPKIVRTGIRKTSVAERLLNAIPAPVSDTLKSAIPVTEKLKGIVPTPAKEKLKSYPSSIVSSSQKLMPWRLKSTIKSEHRTPLVSEYQVFSDHSSDGANDILLPSKYNTSASESDKKPLPRKGSMELSARRKMGQEIAFSLSTDSSASSRSRSLTWDNSSCSDMSEITEPSMYSRPQTFRKAHSMYVVPPVDNLLGSADEDSGVGDNGNGSKNSSSKSRGSRLILSTPSLPNISESKPFNAMSSIEIFSPNVVNRFLHQMKSNDVPINDNATDKWHAVSVLGDEDWQSKHVSFSLDSANRQRVFSDSDVVYELQRRHSGQEINKAVTKQATGALNEVQDDDSLTLFLDNADSTEENDPYAASVIATVQETPSFQTKVVFHENDFPAHRQHSRNESYFWTAIKESFDDDADTSWSRQAPRFPSNALNYDTSETDIDFDDVADGVWSQRRRFASDPFGISNPDRNTTDINDDSTWSPRPRFASDFEATSDHPLAAIISTENGANYNDMDAIWSYEPRFATDAFNNTVTHTTDVDDAADHSWNHEPFASNPNGIFESTTDNVVAENSVDVNASESSWNLSSDSEAANDDVVEQPHDRHSEDNHWTQSPLSGADSDAEDGNTATNASVDFVAVFVVEATDSETKSSLNQKSTFKSDGIVGNNDTTDYSNDHGPHMMFTQRPRYSSEPVAFNDDTDTTTQTFTENMTHIDSVNPRPNFSSDPVTITEPTTNNKIDADADVSTSKLSTASSVNSNNDATDKIIDFHGDSSRDERPGFSSAFLAINENAANSEIEISLHGSLPSWKWSSNQPKDSSLDYYWNQSSDSEKDAEEILLSWGKSDSFDDIL